MKIKVYDGKTRLFPSKRVATEEVFREKYPGIDIVTHCIVTNDSDDIIYQVEPLSAFKEMYNIPPETETEEAIALIQEAMDKPQPQPEPTSTPEERTAKALEALADGQTTENAAALNALLGLE